jgi:hypothetical protein
MQCAVHGLMSLTPGADDVDPVREQTLTRVADRRAPTAAVRPDDAIERIGRRPP